MVHSWYKQCRQSCLLDFCLINSHVRFWCSICYYAKRVPFPCTAAVQGKEKKEKEGERGGKLSLSSKCEKMAKRAFYFKTIADLNHCIGFGQYLWGRGGGGFWLCHNKIHLISPPSLRVFSISMIPSHWQSIFYGHPFNCFKLWKTSDRKKPPPPYHPLPGDKWVVL